MKTLICGMLLLVNNGVINHRANENHWPVSTLRVDVSGSIIDWHITKITGKHDGTIKVCSGQLSLHNRKITGGMILLDMNTIAVTDVTQPDKQKLEANLKGNNFFDTGRFTTARFDIMDVTYAADSLITIGGNLNMHGITKRIAFKAVILRADAQALIARADLIINRRDWNIATGNFKYDQFISPVITLHIVLKASPVNV